MLLIIIDAMLYATARWRDATTRPAMHIMPLFTDIDVAADA